MLKNKKIKLISTCVSTAMLLAVLSSISVYAIDETETTDTNDQEIVEVNNLEESEDETVSGVAQVGDVTYETLQSAIDASNVGDTVTLLADINENIKITKAITLDLNEKTIKGIGDASVVSVSLSDVSSDATLTIKNGTITGGSNASKGGGINLSVPNKGDADVSYTFNLEKLDVIENSARQGGGISIKPAMNNLKAVTSTINISQCNINNNQAIALNGYASNGAGGINIEGMKNLVVNISNTHVEYNDCEESVGGGISFTGGQLNISDSVVSHNSAGTAGGIHISSSYKETPANASIKSTTVEYNKAKVDSGTAGGIGFYGWNYSLIALENTTIRYNESGLYGGGIYATGYSADNQLNLSGNNIISNNKAGYGGGVALFQTNDTIIPTDLVLSNNTVTGFASDLYSYQTVVSLYQKSGKEKLEECNHTIDGWYFDSTNGYEWVGHNEEGKYYCYKMSDNVKYPKSTTLALKAAHGLTNLTVNYIYEDGSEAATAYTKQVEYGEAYNVESPVIDGYVADKTIVEGTIAESEVTETVTYVKTYTYSIHYDTNGGVNGPTDESLTSTNKDNTFTISSVVPTRDGYTFVGWATKSDAEKSDVSESVKVTSEDPTITLYAVWSKNEDPVTPTPTETPEPTSTPEVKKDVTADTSDNSNVLTYAIVTVVGLATVVGIVVARKKLSK